MITDNAALRALAPEWRSLWRRAGASPFQSPAWLLPWWRCFGTGRPIVAVARDGDEMTGLLACYLLDEAAGRKLLPMGVGITDYHDALLADGASIGTAAALLGATLEAARAEDVVACDFPDLPPGAVLRTAPAPAGWRDNLRESSRCPVLERGASIPAGRRRDIRQSMHRAERRGGWAVEIATSNTLDAALDALTRLHALRWQGQGQGQPGVLADARVAAFHRLAAPALLAEGALRLAVLQIAGRVAAACYALLAPGRLLLYLSGFDPGFSHESPGTILLGRLIEDAIAERREMHFLRGGEAYKHAWGGVDRMNATRRLLP